ncbi:RusA family crossover junction endodeoxyribonuclease [Paenibacillus naphthalenovorans]|uniref:RusA family crossover junction endodeoxyribonuclease n=1 Tax=Paenibacillus naphthalenovorans TaxID=162209 RepID=UPI001C312D5D|nr:RusA family crossover junction endodeoxyribonuclease [Paenibacillus naphthalenovorans]
MVKRIKYKLYQPGDKKIETVKRYLSYKEQIAWAARQQYKGAPMTGPIEVNLTFYMPIPGSWSIKKKLLMDGKLHATKPDRDNLEKGVCDALNKIIWKDDGQVCDGRTVKYYSSNPRVEIEIKELSA